MKKSGKRENKGKKENKQNNERREKFQKIYIIAPTLEGHIK